MILRRAERQGGLAIAYAEEACFFADQKLLNHHLGTGGTECTFETGIHGVERFIERHRNDHALACGEPVGLDDDGRTLLADIGLGLGRIVEAAISACRNIEARAEILGETLRPFKLCRSLGGAEHTDTLGTHFIGKASHQWRFRPDHHEIDLLVLGEGNQSLIVIDTDVDEFRDRRNARIAGSAIELCQ